MIKRTPYKHQLEAVDFFEKKDDGFLFFEMGCVSGSTIITVNRNGASKKLTIQKAYEKCPKWRTKQGSIPDLYTRSFLGDRIGLNKIQNIIFSGIKETLKISLECGKSVTLTPDHEILTDKGYRKACDISVGDMVMVDNNEKPQKKGTKKPINYKYTNVKNHPYGRKRVIKYKKKRGGETIREYYIVPTHRLIAEKELNNGNFLDPDKYAVHHIDLNHRNNNKENLLICTHEEHHKIHLDISLKNLSSEITYSKVESIKENGKEETYDLVLSDPHRNFVANKIVVHNCGKTGTAILIKDKWESIQGKKLKTLVLCPPVVLYNWQAEFQMFSDVDKAKIYIPQGTGAKKAEQLQLKFLPYHKNDGIVIVNYEALLNETLFSVIYEWKPDLVICDEVHYLKNHKSKRSKMVQYIAARASKRLGLTGTPLLKNVMDLFGIYRAVDNGNTFGTNEYIFSAKYLIDRNASWKGKTGYFPKWENNPRTFPELNDLIYKKALRKKKEECLDLPDLIKVVRNVEWGKEQKKTYEELKRDFVAFIETSKKEGKKDTVTANLAVTKALRMLQVASGFVQLDSGEVHEFKELPRLEETKELLEELTPEHKVILWCSYRHNYKMLERICKELKIKCVFMTGEQSASEKRESELAFQNDPEVRVIIANRAAGGVGVNLVAASYSIVYSRNFSLAEELQSEARNHRGGSQIHEKIVKIDLAIKDSLDEIVLDALRNKNQISTDILDVKL